MARIVRHRLGSTAVHGHDLQTVRIAVNEGEDRDLQLVSIGGKGDGIKGCKCIHKCIYRNVKGYKGM